MFGTDANDTDMLVPVGFTETDPQTGRTLFWESESSCLEVPEMAIADLNFLAASPTVRDLLVWSHKSGYGRTELLDGVLDAGFALRLPLGDPTGMVASLKHHYLLPLVDPLSPPNASGLAAYRHRHGVATISNVTGVVIWGNSDGKPPGDVVVEFASQMGSDSSSMNLAFVDDLPTLLATRAVAVFPVDRSGI